MESKFNLNNDIYIKEENKINDINIKNNNYNKKEEFYDDYYMRLTSPYKISKETNYYIKRKMKLKKDILNKRKDSIPEEGNDKLSNDNSKNTNGLSRNNYLIPPNENNKNQFNSYENNKASYY